MDTEDRFWQLVNDADYIGNGGNWRKSFSVLVSKGYSKEYIQSFYNFFQSLYQNVVTTVDLDKIKMGDDAFYDFVGYIVSQGRNVYYSYMNNKQNFYSFNSDYHVPESFGYIFLG